MSAILGSCSCGKLECFLFYRNAMEAVHRDLSVEKHGSHAVKHPYATASFRKRSAEAFFGFALPQRPEDDTSNVILGVLGKVEVASLSASICALDYCVEISSSQDFSFLSKLFTEALQRHRPMHQDRVLLLRIVVGLSGGISAHDVVFDTNDKGIREVRKR